MNCNSSFLQYFTWNLSLDVLGAFLVRAIVLSHGLSPAISKVAEKYRDTAPLNVIYLNYNFECDWLIELSDNNLASELVEIGLSSLNQQQSRKL